MIAGHSTNTPQWHGGTLVLREVWERYGEHAATGVSYLEEVPLAMSVVDGLGRLAAAWASCGSPATPASRP